MENENSEYEYLIPGDILQEGDEYFYYDKWEKSKNHGYIICYSDRYYRRKKEKTKMEEKKHETQKINLCTLNSWYAHCEYRISIMSSAICKCHSDNCGGIVKQCEYRKEVGICE